MKNARNCSRCSADKEQTRSLSPGWRDGRSIDCAGEGCPELRSEKQELLANLMEGKLNVQMVAPDEFQRQIWSCQELLVFTLSGTRSG